MIASSAGTRGLARALAAGEWIVAATLPDDEDHLGELARRASALRPVVTVVVIEERPGVVRALTPAHRAHLLREAGLGVVVALSGRDRNRVALEGELVALAHIGVDAVLVHSAEYPHPVPGRAPAPRVDDLNEDALAALARRVGLVTALFTAAGAAPDTLAAHVAGRRADLMVVASADAGQVAELGAALAARGVGTPLIVRIPGYLPPAAAEHLIRDVAALPGVAGVQVSAPEGATGDDAVGALAELAAVSVPTKPDVRA